MELQFDNISKSYGATLALNRFSASLTPGIYAILGPNGSGKSTLMNILTGNLRADSGVITYAGDDGKAENILDMGGRFREKLGFMPQYPGMYPNFSVHCFLGYVAALKDVGAGQKRRERKQIIARQIEVFKQVEVGAVAPNFMALTSEGDTIALHATPGKLKLIDFWASWCGPCRAEMPNVKKVYKKYHDQGLEIIGISIDQKVDDWTKALQEERLPWPNIIDPQGQIASVYLVRAIPHTLLLDENNVIVAKNLRGKALEKKVAELLNNQ